MVHPHDLRPELRLRKQAGERSPVEAVLALEFVQERQVLRLSRSGASEGRRS